MCVYFNKELPEELQQIPSTKVPRGEMCDVSSWFIHLKSGKTIEL